MTPITREDYLEIIRMAELAGRLDDMRLYMRRFIETFALKQTLSIEERDLVYMAYKMLIARKRSSLYILNKRTEQALAREYVFSIELELKEIIGEFNELLEKYLIPSAKRCVETRAYFMKIKADFFRYLIDLDSNGEIERQNLIRQSNLAYKSVMEFVRKELLQPACNPIRLGLALSYSVFYYEVLKLPEQACELAKEEFDFALMNLDDVQDVNEMKNCKFCLQLLRDNLIQWTTEVDEEKQQLFKNE